MALFDTKLFIFDLDGTLVDTRTDISNSINQVLKDNDVPELHEEKIWSFIGNGVAFLVEKCLGRAHMDKYDKVYDDYMLLYEKNMTKNLVVYEGVEDVLKHFSEQKKVILSNKPEAFCKKILDTIDFSKYFDEVCGGDTFPVMKPEKKGVKTLYKKYGMLQEETLMVGDGPQDINAARNAGIKMAAVTYGYHSENRLKKENPDLLIDTIEALKNYID